MNREYEILKYVHQEEYTSQRKIAANTSCSLGAVNFILKRLIKKGLIKIERLNARSLKYVLTPKGIVEKTKLTYQYIQSSYVFINKLNQAILDIAIKAQKNKMGKIFLCGPKDEVLTILRQELSKQKIDYDYLTETISLSDNDTGVVVVWRVEEEEQFKDFNTVNILKMITIS